jgi:hypothetical protein
MNVCPSLILTYHRLHEWYLPTTGCMNDTYLPQAAWMLLTFQKLHVCYLTLNERCICFPTSSCNTDTSLLLFFFTSVQVSSDKKDGRRCHPLQYLTKGGIFFFFCLLNSAQVALFQLLCCKIIDSTDAIRVPYYHFRKSYVVLRKNQRITVYLLT